MFDFRDCTSCAADADKRQRRIFQPGIFFQATHDKITYVAENCRRHFIFGIEHRRQINAAKGQADRINNSAVAKKNQFRTAAAQVKDDAVFDVDRVDYAQVAGVGFGLAAEYVQMDFCFFFHKSRKLFAIFGVAHRSSGYSNNLIYCKKFAHGSKTAHAFERVGKSL